MCGRRPWTPPARPAAPSARCPVKELGALAREGRWWPWSPTPVRVPVQGQSRRNTRGHGRCAHPGARGPAGFAHATHDIVCAFNSPRWRSVVFKEKRKHPGEKAAPFASDLRGV